MNMCKCILLAKLKSLMLKNSKNILIIIKILVLTMKFTVILSQVLKNIMIGGVSVLNKIIIIMIMIMNLTKYMINIGIQLKNVLTFIKMVMIILMIFSRNFSMNNVCIQTQYVNRDSNRWTF